MKKLSLLSALLLLLASPCLAQDISYQVHREDFSRESAICSFYYQRMASCLSETSPGDMMTQGHILMRDILNSAGLL